MGAGFVTAIAASSRVMALVTMMALQYIHFVFNGFVSDGEMMTVPPHSGHLVW
jgi:hypothetical protein